MAFIDKIKERAKADKKTIVLPESMDKRTYEAAEKILKEGIANLIIIGTPEEIEKNGKGFDISGATIVDPYNDPNKQKYIDKFVELRGKKGVTPEVAKEQMRFALSPLESELAAMNRTEEDLKRLKDSLEVLREETDAEERVLLDRAFHRIISSMTRNPFLEREMNNYQDLSIRLLFLNRINLSSIDDMDIGHHEEIYRCLQERDVDKLISVQKAHVQAFKEKFIR